MEDSYSENQNYSLEEELIRPMDFSSPQVTPEIAELPLNEAPFEIEAEDNPQEFLNVQRAKTQTYDTTNSNQSSIDHSMIQEVMDDHGPYGVLQSFKSQQIKRNSAIVDEETFPQISKSTEIIKEPKKYEDQDRMDKLERYLSKKEQRNFEKRVMYQSRKRVADERQRVGGRFQKQATQQNTQINTVEITPKKPRQTLGKNETFANSHTKSSIKGKR